MRIREAQKQKNPTDPDPGSPQKQTDRTDPDADPGSPILLLTNPPRTGIPSYCWNCCAGCQRMVQEQVDLRHPSRLAPPPNKRINERVGEGNLSIPDLSSPSWISDPGST